MSVAALSWALDHAPAELSTVERFVLVALADHVDDETRKAWPSVARIMRRTGCSRRAVQRALRSLEQHGIITSAHQKAPSGDHAGLRPNLYLWHPERATGYPAGPVDNPPNGASHRRPIGACSSKRGVSDDRQGRQGDALTIKEPSDNPSVVEVREQLSPVHSPQAGGDDNVRRAARQWWDQLERDSGDGPSLHVRDWADRARAALRAAASDNEVSDTTGEWQW